jgi:TRAP-type mannitol/chloroaromatic compound transport system permease small subunit
MILENFMERIETLSATIGKGASWLAVALMLSIGYEVIMRYGLRAPTLWSFDMSYMLGGSLYVLGFAWVLREDGNVRVDILSSRFSKKTQLYINLIFTLLLFFPPTPYGTLPSTRSGPSFPSLCLSGSSRESSLSTGRFRN